MKFSFPLISPSLFHNLIKIKRMATTKKLKSIKDTLRIVLGVFMIIAAIGHFTFGREAFQAQVPNWIPLDKDLIVILSGVVEILLGISMIFLTQYKAKVGIVLAIFYVLVFPGNIAQYINGTSAFGLETDTLRFIRLFFQPVLILWALWSTDAFSYLKEKKEE
ncbi:Uncharacterized membrane protein [Chishuiella changwenlii]|uniref:Uncharacterized membrane protein n=2 Tax=Chishuiella changwenlii TaxID=1434701 RepID=A0A1M6SRH8_9FLAO|nr:Uncharacterized membrane protein [Chishuiella changwenlii]